ncbi:SelB C-terminal domain-containing protein [Nocardioides sp. SOB77]|uniref:SelB C-terminal domain-containing protein n=1 Tax=Nocardioides oceani TaxID=3058369 RepID=A0ABT8FA20_9ACTN|nr:selenocysteine-specific translation elongation factor [Nocardioides oceani]MDN4171517.1 SelB C-terminal domain-containing protein [Nocardioides oceani]
MHVVATAGHVDHGKSTLVHALTGMEPDRLAEERARGLSIQLGYAWAELAGEQVAFVDVPGHERFVTTMLAGIGPVPAALLVVAADDPWMPQAAEHLAALDALGVAHGVVAVTRSDLADPAAAVARARAEVDRTSLAGAPVVPVSARTGLGLDELRHHLAAMVAGLPRPDPAGDVRLWVDRRFTITGAGTVVTGTLPAGTVRRGDALELWTDGPPAAVRVRGVQSLGAGVDAATGVARVALNVTGDGLDRVDRDSVLVTPGAHHPATTVDVRVTGEGRMPERPVLHVGAASFAVRARPLAGDEGALVRLVLPRPVPLRVGDRALLRDPGSRRVWGLQVLDPEPPGLGRRGAAAARAQVLADVAGEPDLAGELDRRGLASTGLLRRLGVPVAPLPAGAVEADGTLVSAVRAAALAREVVELVRRHDADQPLDRGVPVTAVADRLGVPAAVVAAVAPRVSGGRVVLGDASPALPPELERALEALGADLADEPFAAPPADRLAELGLDARRTAAAAKAGRLLRLAPAVVLLPGADARAVELLRALPQPFTTSQARQALGTSRRVVLPLLEHLDRAGRTRRLPDDRRQVVDR